MWTEWPIGKPTKLFDSRCYPIHYNRIRIHVTYDKACTHERDWLYWVYREGPDRIPHVIRESLLKRDRGVADHCHDDGNWAHLIHN